MNKKNLKDLMLILVPLALLIGASVTLVSTGIITFEKPNNTADEITVALKVDNGENVITYEITTDNSTAFGVLEQAEKETDLTFQSDYFEEFQSHIINSINGIDSTDSNYWIFYLNGEMASVGVDQQYVKDGDIILFKYEESTW